MRSRKGKTNLLIDEASERQRSLKLLAVLCYKHFVNTQNTKRRTKE